MALFICPNCEQRSEIKEDNEAGSIKHICPNCGHEFGIDAELNVIVEE
jgi:predicted RNA-binding Zn-ribbon protein involved in translation (DUF1610 family)